MSPRDPGHGEDMEITIDGQKVNIRWVPPSQMRRDHAGHGFAGDYDDAKKQIRVVREGTTRAGWRMTIFHELYHHAQKRDGLELTKAQVEDTASAAEWLLIALWDNPKLARILTTKPK